MQLLNLSLDEWSLVNLIARIGVEEENKLSGKRR